MTARSKSALGAQAPALGFLVDLLEDGYQSAIAAGVVAAARNSGASVHCFVGGVLEALDRAAPQRNHVYQLASHVTLDGLVVLGGTLVNQIGPAEVSRYFERCRGMPMCSVGMPLDAMGSVLINNEVGMQGAIEHLIKIHNHTRIAFLRGPLANAEAELRFQVYRRALELHGIAFDPRLVVVGNFQSDSGHAAVVRLLDELHVPIQEIDAIVVSNDNMAFGVLRELQARRIRVPEDVAVTGFDDVEEARYVNPGLTTVRQPLEEQGREAVRMVLKALQQKEPLVSVQLATDLVIRGSCGCSGTKGTTRSSDAQSLSLGFEAMLVSRRQHILDALARSARGTLMHAGSGWEPKLVATIAAELRGESTGAAVKLFEELVHGLLIRGTDVSYAHAVLNCLRRELLLCLQKDTERRAFAEDLFQDIRMTIGATTERMLGASRLHVEQWSRRLSTVGARLIGTFDIHDLREAVSENFPILGISNCFVVLYEKGEPSAKFSQLVLAYDSEQRQKQPLPVQFATESLLPGDVIDRFSRLHDFVIAPLYFKQEVFGYLVIEFDVGQSYAYEAVRDLISAALKGAMLVQDVKRQNVELDSAVSLIQENETRHAQCLVRVRSILSEIARGSLNNPRDILDRLESVIPSD